MTHNSKGFIVCNISISPISLKVSEKTMGVSADNEYKTPSFRVFSGTPITINLSIF